MGRGLARYVCPLFFPAITDSVHLLLHNLPTDSRWRSFESEGLPVPMPYHWDMGLTTQPLPNCPRGHQCLLSVFLLVNVVIIMQTLVLAMGSGLLLFSQPKVLPEGEWWVFLRSDWLHLFPAHQGIVDWVFFPFFPMGSGDRMILEENVNLYNSVTELYSHTVSDAFVSWLSVYARDAIRLEFSWTRVLIWSKYRCFSIFKAEKISVQLFTAKLHGLCWGMVAPSLLILWGRSFTANGKH